MNALLTFIGLLGGICAFVLTIIAAFNLRKPRKITVLTTLLSVLISLLALLAMILLGGLRVRGLVGVPFFLLGLLLGFLRGLTVRLSWHGRQVIAENSVLFVILWGFSLVLSLLMGMLEVPVLASLGLVPAIFSTGLQAGYYFNLFLRRITLRPR